MGRLNEEQLKNQIKNGEFSNLYLIYGEESYLKEHYVNKLKKALVDSAFADFNLHVHEKSSKIDDVLMDAQMMPMMGEYTVVVVHDYPLTDSKEYMDKLKEFFKDVPETCVLIFWLDSIVFDEKKDSKWQTVVNAFSKAGEAVNLEKRSESDLARLVSAKVKKAGCEIDSSVARYFVNAVGSDIQTIVNEIEKLCYFVPGGSITRETVDKLAVKSLQARVFDLSKFILAGDGDRAYSALRVLFSQREEPISILAVIASYYIDMYRAKCARTTGVSENDVLDYYNYGGRKWILSNAARDGAKISVEALRNAIDILSETDEMMKSTSVDNNLLLEETIAKLLLIRNK